MIKLIQLLELGINKPSITFIPKEQIYTWEYIGGASKELEQYLPIAGYLISGVLIFNKYLFLASAPDKDGMYNGFNAKYFIRKNIDTWFKQDIDLEDNPITLNNLKILG